MSLTVYLYIGEYQKEECLIIPFSMLTGFNVLEFVIKLAKLFISRKVRPVTTSYAQSLLPLKFFKACNTIAKQEALRNAIKSSISKIDMDAGRDWIVVYIVYCFHTGNQRLTKKYASFFHDIDLLLPGLLNNVCLNEKTDSQRYRKYTQMLSIECSYWFVLNGCLPPLSKWTSREFVYNVDHKRQRFIQTSVVEMLKCLQS